MRRSFSGKVPPISAGVPFYTGEKYLQVALDALLKQTITDFEIIPCDNASTDATQAVCEEYAARDKRIRYYGNARTTGATSISGARSGGHAANTSTGIPRTRLLRAHLSRKV